MRLRIVFMGTPDFAVPSLKMLIDEGYEIAAVVTQPDKPKGRGNKMSFPPVKECALQEGIEVLQPSTIRTEEFDAILKSIHPDLLVTVAYGKILPQNILEIPSYGCINVHGSILPKYRGAAPIHWAIINGEKETGITTMYTDIGTDTGDMLQKSYISIGDDMTVGELHDQLAVVGAELLKETLLALRQGNLERTPQPSEEATYAPMISKELGRINWEKSAEVIHNLVRGTNPWPGAYTFYKGERMRIWKTSRKRLASSCTPGRIHKVTKEGITVGTMDEFVEIKEIQFDSGRKMSVEEYIRGHNIDEGEILG